MQITDNARVKIMQSKPENSTSMSLLPTSPMLCFISLLPACLQGTAASNNPQFQSDLAELYPDVFVRLGHVSNSIPFKLGWYGLGGAVCASLRDGVALCASLNHIVACDGSTSKSSERIVLSNLPSKEVKLKDASRGLAWAALARKGHSTQGIFQKLTAFSAAGIIQHWPLMYAVPTFSSTNSLLCHHEGAPETL